MVFGLSKPSRSYASESSGIWDAATGFSAPPAASPVSRRPVTVARTASWQGEQSSLNNGADERRRTKSRRKDEVHDSPRSTRSAGRNSNARVSFINQPGPPLPTNSSSTALATAVRATHKPPISKRERQRRTEDLRAEFENFSVMDLAPPPVRRRLQDASNGGDVFLEDGSDLDSGSGLADSRVQDSLANVPREAERSRTFRANKAKRSGGEQYDEAASTTGYGAGETEASELGQDDWFDREGTKRKAASGGGTIKAKKSQSIKSARKNTVGGKTTSTTSKVLPPPAAPSANVPRTQSVDYYQASQMVGITAPPAPPMNMMPGMIMPHQHLQQQQQQLPGPPRRRISTTLPPLLGGPVAYGGGYPYDNAGAGVTHPGGRVDGMQTYDGYQQGQGYDQREFQHPQQHQQPYYEQVGREQRQQQRPRPTIASSSYDSHGELTPPSSEHHDLQPVRQQLRAGSPSRSHRSPSPNAGHSLSYGPSSPWHVMVQPEAMPSRKYARSGLQPSTAGYDEDEQELSEGEEDALDGRREEGEVSGSSSLVGTGTGSSLEGQHVRAQAYPSPRKEMMQARERERQRATQQLHGDEAHEEAQRNPEPDRRTSDLLSHGSRSDSPLRMVHPVPMETIYSEDPPPDEERGKQAPPMLGMPILGPVVSSPGPPIVQIVEAPPGSQQHVGMMTSPPTSFVSQDALAPPTFSVQPPTPQHEIDQPEMELESPSPLGQRAVPVNSQVSEIQQSSNMVDIGSVRGYPMSSMGPPLPPITKTGETTTPRSRSQPSSAETSQESSPRSSSGPAFSFAKSMKSSRSTPSMPPAPVDPDATAFLKWDPRMQRWMPVPVTGLQAPVPPRSHGAESVASSVSAYSQASAPAPALGQPVYTSSRTRRQSLPHLSMAMAPPRQARRQPSPAPAMHHSRPTSPAPSESGYSRAPPSPTAAAGSSFPARRMSIEPAYRMEASTLTLLPELREDGTLALNPSQSRPQSRIGSVQDFRESVQSGTSPNLAFPRANGRSVVSSPATSEVGDHAIPEDEAVDYTRPKSRQGSVYAGSQYGGSQFGDNAGPRRAGSVAGREAGLATMSVRSDAVPLYQSDGGDTTGGGYSSLVLPTGTYKPTADPTKDLNKIDPRVLGMPHSTMSTITLTSTAGRHSRRNSVSSLFRPQQSPTPVHLLDDLPAPVTFTSTVPPPSKISDSQILVQVYAVALDRFDAEMVRDKAASGAGAGKWIPGRAFFGRAMEVGGEVRAIIKGDLVIGLVDIKKSGMLAEYVTIDRRRVARVPMGITLSQEEITCLPLLGVMAHRACIAVARGSRAFITNAHEGIGSLVCQELAANGVLVTAQVPVDVDSAEDDAWDNGAREVLVGDAVGLINLQHESGFDYVLDTVGGRRIYDASRRIMRTQGRFVTLYGDDSARATSAPPLKTSLHALRRAFIKKDKKAINYVHLVPGTGGDVDLSGQDTRDILELPIMAEYRPKVGMVLPFERAPEAFEELMGLFGLGGENGKGARGKEVVGEIVVRLNN